MDIFKILINVGYLLLLLLVIGTIGFKYFAAESWVDAFQTAVFYITGLGSTLDMPSTSAKIWSSIFALIATTIFIGIAANIVADVVEEKFIRNS